jgi:hypothetical protein
MVLFYRDHLRGKNIKKKKLSDSSRRKIKSNYTFLRLQRDVTGRLKFK